MARILVCLPLCLLLAPAYPPLASREPQLTPLVPPGRPEVLLLAGTTPCASFPAAVPWGGLSQFAQTSPLPLESLGLFVGVPAARFPANLALAALWLSAAEGTTSAAARPDRDPIAFLEKCLERYDREVKGYTLMMRKQERIDDTLYPVEVIKVYFRDQPFSVFFQWLQNHRKALRVLYVAGANDNKMLALPTIKIVGVVVRDLDSPDAKQSGRYTLAQFGLKQALQRVVTNWKKARAAKALHVEYLGVQKVVEAGNRPCHKFHRTRYAQPEDNGVTELILYIDTQTQLQVGSVLLGANGQLLGEYFFKDIQLNPTFRPDQFKRAALTAR